MWQIFAALWLLVNLADWIFAHTQFWQLTSIVPTPIFVLVDIILLSIGIINADLLVIILSVLSFLAQLPYLDINWRPKRTSIISDSTLKIFDWNTLFWHKDEQELADFLHSQNADIYHLQEAWLKSLKTYDISLFVEKYFPGFNFAQNKDVATISKLPINQVIKGTNCLHFGCWLRVDVEWQGQNISLYNVHMPVPFEIAYLFRPRMFYKYWRIFQSGRELMTLELSQQLQSNQNPLVITGDFNTIKRQPPIRDLLSVLEEAGGFGDEVFPITLKAFKKLSLWRVDWVLLRGLKPLNYSRQKYTPISDHYPILVEVTLPKQA